MSEFFVTKECGLFTLRDGSTNGVIRVRAQEAQGVQDYANTAFCSGDILNWRIRGIRADELLTDAPSFIGRLAEAYEEGRKKGWLESELGYG